jgi:hypothetical protein
MVFVGTRKLAVELDGYLKKPIHQAASSRRTSLIRKRISLAEGQEENLIRSAILIGQKSNKFKKKEERRKNKLTVGSSIGKFFKKSKPDAKIKPPSKSSQNSNFLLDPKNYLALKK